MTSTPASVTRPLVEADHQQTMRVAREAFGMPPAGSPEVTPEQRRAPGRHEWGTFVGDDLVARIASLELASWFGGVTVPTTGIAGVSVAVEQRGAGLLTDLMRAAVEDGLERGHPISTLYPTAPGIYRRFGYETVTSLLTVELPTSALPTRPVAGVVLRRATAADVPEIRDVYDTWAAAQNGPLTRRGHRFEVDPAGYLHDSTGVSLAEAEDGRLLGFVSWRRGEGYGDRAAIEVDDLLATDPRAYAALWRSLAGWSSVAPTVRLTASEPDVARLWLPSAAWTVTRSRPYMLRISDVAAALSARPATGDAALSFAVGPDALDGVRRAYTLTAADGRIDCRLASDLAHRADDGPTFARRELALLYAGVQTYANLRMAGLLTGSSAHDAAVDALLDRRPVHVRDYF